MTDEIRIIPPKLTKKEWNSLLDHSLIKEASYIIYTKTINGTQYYYALNGTTGKIDYGGPNNIGGINGLSFGDVMNTVIANSGEGVHIYICKGCYIIDKKIIIDRRITLVGAGAGATSTFMDGMAILYLQDNFADNNAFELRASSGLTNTWWQIPIFEKLVLYGNKNNQTHQVNCFEQKLWSAVDIQFHYLWFDSWNGHAIVLRCYYQHRIDTCWFEHFNPDYAAIAIEAYSRGEPSRINIINSYCLDARLYETLNTEYPADVNIVDCQFTTDQGITTLHNPIINLEYTETFKIRGCTFNSCSIAILQSGNTTRSQIITENTFGGGGYDCLNPIVGDINPNYPSVIRNNRGYVTESSGTEVGTGNKQPILHGLGYYQNGLVPLRVYLVANDDGMTTLYESQNADSLYIYVTATNGKKYTWKVEACSWT